MIKQKQAFTLVELIVVITILAILGTIAFISLQGYSKDARDSVRISHVSNMKTSLELFHLDAGKYPLPDDGATVLYSGAVVWTQGDFGNTVLSSLSRSMSEVPTDPLNDKKYIFSVSGNRNEFEILNPLEGDLAFNTLGQANAVEGLRTAKLSGVFNALYVKTGNYIVPTPSLITAEAYTSGDDISNQILSSMVIEGYTNMPAIGSTARVTGGLTGISLSATGAINSKSTDAEKIGVMKAIQAAYDGSDLATGNLYSFILSKTSDAEILALSNSIVLNIEELVEEVVITCDPGYLLDGETCYLPMDYPSGINIITSTYFTALDNTGDTISPEYNIGRNEIYISHPGGRPYDAIATNGWWGINDSVGGKYVIFRLSQPEALTHFGIGFAGSYSRSASYTIYSLDGSNNWVSRYSNNVTADYPSDDFTLPEASVWKIKFIGGATDHLIDMGSFKIYLQ